MTAPILYSFRRCPYAMRARMALDVANIDVEHREVLLRDKPSAMLEASPKGTVPVLVLPSGEVIDESLDVMLWALDQDDPENWVTDKETQIAEIDAFLDRFKGHLDRYKYASRYDETVDRGSVNIAERVLAMAALESFTVTLQDAPFLGGDRPDLRDIASFPFVRQFAAVEPDWWNLSATPALQSWLMALISSDRFKRIMAKHTVWSQNSGEQ